MKRTIIIFLLFITFLIPKYHVSAEIYKSNEYKKPVGIIEVFTGSKIPGGYLLADGREVSRSEYRELFEVIGTIYGMGDGATTFNLPNLRGKTVVGEDSSQSEFSYVGKIGGEKTHVLKQEELPSHTHLFTGNSIASGNNSQTPTATFTGNTTYTTLLGNHTHSRGNMEISGTFITRALTNGANIAANDYNSGAFSMTVDGGPSWVAAINYTGGLNLITDRINFYGSRYWTGATSASGAHQHSISSYNGNVSLSGTTHTHNVTASGKNGTVGENKAHNNLQPYITLKYLIRYQ